LDRTCPTSMCVVSQFALAVCGAGSELENQERGEFGGLPTRWPVTWPGRQYTNLLRCSQAGEHHPLQFV